MIVSALRCGKSLPPAPRPARGSGELDFADGSGKSTSACRGAGEQEGQKQGAAHIRSKRSHSITSPPSEVVAKFFQGQQSPALASVVVGVSRRRLANLTSVADCGPKNWAMQAGDMHNHSKLAQINAQNAVARCRWRTLSTGVPRATRAAARRRNKFVRSLPQGSPSPRYAGDLARRAEGDAADTAMPRYRTVVSRIARIRSSNRPHQRSRRREQRQSAVVGEERRSETAVNTNARMCQGQGDHRFLAAMARVSRATSTPASRCGRHMHRPDAEMLVNLDKTLLPIICACRSARIRRKTWKGDQ
jgi:hypothetical protein